MDLTPAGGEDRLPVLLANLRPMLHPEPFVFVTLSDAEAARVSEQLATFREAEGMSIVIRQDEADRLRLRYDSTWAMITLQIHSSLTAVGFLAALLPLLAVAGISVNPIAAYHHDHLFVPWDRREEAMRVLNKSVTPPVAYAPGSPDL
jgi:uncharacterized protein